MHNGHETSRLADMLVAETVRSIEDDAPLEDSEAMQRAFHSRTGDDDRLIERARALGERLKLDRELARWRSLAGIGGLVLAALVFFVGYGIAASVIGADRSLNAVLAFFVVLGIHALTLVLWAVAVAASAWSRKPATTGSLSFGGLLLRLVAWLPVDRGPHSLTMLSSTIAVLRRARLLPWAFGTISHLVWAGAFLLVLAALGFAFSFREYRLTWETTILSADFFVRFVQITGWLPHLLGFSLPDTATLVNPASNASDQRAWAWWLIGCTVVYGLAPRLVLAIASWLVWRRRARAMRLDSADPYFRKLLARFAEMEASVVVDAEQRPDAPIGNGAMPPPTERDARAIIGFELPPDYPWPPDGLGEQAALTMHVSGSSDERRALQNAIARVRPHRILIVCNPASSPDRGTERFIREAGAYGAQCAVLLQPAPGGESGNPQRWQFWLEKTGLGLTPAFTNVSSASEWVVAHD